MRRLSDKQVEIFISQVLRAGVLLSCLVTIIGIGLYLPHYSFSTPNYRVFHVTDGTFFHFRELVPNVLHGNPIAIIQLGVLILIATPIARVAFLVFAFAWQRDKLYVAVSSLVLAILLYSFLFSS